MTPLNVVPFVSVDNMMKLVLELGIERVLVDLAGYIETDFKRWPEFDKTPRVASHSDVGVIELMPTSDGEFYGFKYVNGPPEEHARRAADGDGLWPEQAAVADGIEKRPVMRGDQHRQPTGLGKPLSAVAVAPKIEDRI